MSEAVHLADDECRHHDYVPLRQGSCVLTQTCIAMLSAVLDFLSKASSTRINHCLLSVHKAHAERKNMGTSRMC